MDIFPPDGGGEPAAKRTLLSEPGVGISVAAAIFLSYQLLGMLASVVMVPVKNAVGISQASYLLTVQGLSQLLFLLLPTAVAAKILSDSPQRVLRLGGSVSWLQWILSLAGLVFLIVGIQGAISSIGAVLPENIRRILVDMYQRYSDSYSFLFSYSTGGYLLSVVCAALIPAVAEEALFRGLLQRSMEGKVKAGVAIAATAFVFAAAHLSPVSFLQLFFLGCFMGFASYYTQSIAVAVVLHFFNNLFSITAMSIYGSQDAAAYSPETPLQTSILLALTGFIGCLGTVAVMIGYTPQSPRDE